MQRVCASSWVLALTMYSQCELWARGGVWGAALQTAGGGHMSSALTTLRAWPGIAKYREGGGHCAHSPTRGSHVYTDRLTVRCWVLYQWRQRLSTCWWRWGMPEWVVVTVYTVETGRCGVGSPVPHERCLCGRRPASACRTLPTASSLTLSTRPAPDVIATLIIPSFSQALSHGHT